MWALLAALYRIAKRWWRARAAVFAIAIAGTMPLLYGLTRWYMVEYMLTALVAVAACVLIESDGLKRDRLVILFGGICGFGLLLKISFPLFILPLFVYIWLTSGRGGRPLLLAALPCVVLRAPWYAGHFRSTAAFALESGFGALATIYGTGPISPLHHHNVLVTRGGQRRLLVFRASQSY
jgi:4-amino-4-deoxy-L-arabinose transferase-like glycosyltransferase